ncbi:unnamed protein product, partial [Symbiodinium sp. CCMP2456]
MVIVRMADTDQLDGVAMQQELGRSAARTLLKNEPIILHFDGPGHTRKIGGQEQLTQQLLRKVAARMHLWVTLVKEVVRAELPCFESFHSITTLLQLDEDPGDIQEAADRMAHVLNLPVDSLMQLATLTTQLFDVKPLAAGIRAQTKKPALECWARAVSEVALEEETLINQAQHEWAAVYGNCRKVATSAIGALPLKFHGELLSNPLKTKSAKRLCMRRKKKKVQSPMQCETVFLKKRRQAVQAAVSSSDDKVPSPRWMKRLAEDMWSAEHEQELSFNRQKHRKKAILAFQAGTYKPECPREKRKLQSDAIEHEKAEKKRRKEHVKKIAE